MKSERARACLEKCAVQGPGIGKIVTYAEACAIVTMVEEEAEERLQALREQFAADRGAKERRKGS